MSKTTLVEKLLALEQAADQRRNAVSDLHQQARALAASGEHARAQGLYERLVAESPQNAAGWAGLAGEWLEQGDFDAAFSAILRALALEPWAARHHGLFGRLRAGSGERGRDREYADVTGLRQRRPEMWACGASLEAAGVKLRAQVAADDKDGWVCVGNLMLAMQDLASAVSSYERAAAIDDREPLTWENFSYALEIAGEQAKASHARANFLYHSKQYAEAIENFRALLATDLADWRTYRSLADCYFRSGQFEQGCQICREGIAEHGGVEELYVQFAHETVKQNRAAEAANLATAASVRFPDSLLLKFIAGLGLPIIYRDEEELAYWRRRFGETLEEIEQELRLETPAQRAAAREALRVWSNFYLAYQGQDDRELQIRYAQIIHRIMKASYPQWTTPRRVPGGSGRLRVGYLSAFFRMHSVANTSIGWLQGHDRQQFEIFTYYTGRSRDPVAAEYEKLSDHYRHHPDADGSDVHFERLCQRILADDLHVLVYPDLAMWPAANMLAALRLAPVQCTSWGHPITSGLPTVDYFLSGDLMEPAGAERHYTEELVRLPNVGVPYRHPGELSGPMGRAKYSIAEDAVVYLSCQSLYKYLPQHDQLYPEIARQVPRACFVFLLLGTGGADEVFRARMRSAFARVGLDSDRFCMFLPPWGYLGYRGLLAVSDVFLDTLDWSSANTAFEAAATALPIVTTPGEFMRGRHCYAILRMLGMPELIAADKEQYVVIAAALGNRPEWREQVRARMLADQSRLFNDRSSVKALENFYRQAIAQRVQ